MLKSLLEEAGIVFGFVLITGFVLLHVGIGDVNASSYGFDSIIEISKSFS